MLLRAKTAAKITTIFTDLGGVILTNGWDREMRRRAAEVCDLDYDEMNERHHLTFDTYETGKISLDTYLDRVIFYEPRPFSRDRFRRYMFEQSQPYPEMLTLFRALSGRDGVRMAAVSNEGRELAVHRLRTFGLTEFISVFVVSSFVHLRKPDEDIYRFALDIAQASPEQVVYAEDRLMFATVAHGLGLNCIHHTGYESTRAALAELGLPVPGAELQRAA